jgi:hypothetical protein
MNSEGEEKRNENNKRAREKELERNKIGKCGKTKNICEVPY